MDGMKAASKAALLRWLPGSLFGRLMGVLVIGLLLAQGLSALINVAERDRPCAHPGVYGEEGSRWREHPHHQRTPGEPQGAGGLCGVPGLTSPTSRRCPPRSSG
jgi:hypothetical protein